MKQSNAIQLTRYDDGQLYALMYAAEHQENAYVCHVKGTLCKSIDDFFREISSGMRFPHYFGWNWDAFDECITDLEWLKFSCLVIVIDNYELLFIDENSPEVFRELLIKHLTIALEYWKSQKVPIAIILNQKTC